MDHQNGLTPTLFFGIFRQSFSEYAAKSRYPELFLKLVHASIYITT